jgi:hypothetical protein
MTAAGNIPAGDAVHSADYYHKKANSDYLNLLPEASPPIVFDGT